MPAIRKFFCFNLFTAGCVIGWMGLAISIVQCLANILVVENIDSVITPKNFPNETDLVPIRTFVVSALAISIVLRIIDIIACGLLIAGSVKRNHLLLLPWLINGGVSLLFASLSLSLMLFYLLSIDYTLIIPFNLTVIVLFALYVYTFIAIYSLYCVIRDSNRSNEYSRLIDDGNARHPIYTRG